MPLSFVGVPLVPFPSSINVSSIVVFVEVIILFTVKSPLIVTAPVNVADKSDANVKIVSSILFGVTADPPAAVADLNTIEPPAAVPLPAPPRNTN